MIAQQKSTSGDEMRSEPRNVGSTSYDSKPLLGISPQEVADRAGLTKSHIWDIEAGNARNPTLGAMIGIARALGVSLDYLTGASNFVPGIHPEAMRIALEIDALLRKGKRP